jgi:hypothetical protein
MNGWSWEREIWYRERSYDMLLVRYHNNMAKPRRCVSDIQGIRTGAHLELLLVGRVGLGGPDSEAVYNLI